jgi:hypothetical protein
VEFTKLCWYNSSLDPDRTPPLGKLTKTPTVMGCVEKKRLKKEITLFNWNKNLNTLQGVKKGERKDLRLVEVYVPISPHQRGVVRQDISLVVKHSCIQGGKTSKVGPKRGDDHSLPQV